MVSSPPILFARPPRGHRFGLMESTASFVMADGEGCECECRRVRISNAVWRLIVDQVEPVACGGEW